MTARRLLDDPQLSTNGASDVFSLGVASGDPLPDGVVLWTRLAPDPVNGGGMPAKDVPVEWQLATDENFRHVVRRGNATATSRYAHSVHVDVRGLEPGAWYWYRFRERSHVSPIGRTRTAPATRSSPRGARFAIACCQNYEHGYYAAYRHMADEDLDFVVHLGDYIYENGAHSGTVRTHDGPELLSLDQYRNRYALYKTDPHLQAAHAAFPFVVTFDDHEVENNYAGTVAEQSSQTRARKEFLERRAAAYRAYWEHQPLRGESLPRGPDMALYRRINVGDLAELSVLDTRQYRTDQPCGDGLTARCPAALDPAATMTGPAQERWLLRGLDRSTARWNVVAQQTMLAQLRFPFGSGGWYTMDEWDGYVAARNRLLAFLLRRRPSNPVVISGDTHASWANDLKADFDDPDSETVAAEFAAPSITSDCAEPFVVAVQASLGVNPHIRLFDGAWRGYVRCDLDRERWRTDFRAVRSIRSPGAPAFTLASFEVQDGVAGCRRIT